MHQCKEDCNKVYVDKYLSCTNCQSKLYFNCIAQRKGGVQLLQTFGLYDSGNDTHIDDYAKSVAFKTAFGLTSLIGYVCQTCRAEFKSTNEKVFAARAEINDMNNRIARVRESLSMPNTDQNAQQSTSKDDLSHVRPEQSNQNKSLGHLNQSKRQSVYSIFVPKFPAETTVDEIVGRILDKTDIDNPGLFKVEQIRMKKWKNSVKKFVSFKISTLTKELFDKIICDSVWGPNHTACLFQTFSERSSRSDSQQKVDQKNKQKQMAHKPKPNPPNLNVPKVKVQPKPNPNNKKRPMVSRRENLRVNHQRDDHPSFDQWKRGQTRPNNFEYRREQTFHRGDFFEDLMKLMFQYRNVPSKGNSAPFRNRLNW